MGMRIIGGEFRGRRIKQPDRATVRPTKDRIREAVFNVIAEKVPGADILDVFAGSGAYGLEALSRGAKRATFIDRDELCASVISENIQALSVQERAKVIAADTAETLKFLGKNKERFDLVFADPPYNMNMARKALIMINQYDILNPSGFLILEHHSAETVPESEGDVSICRQKSYGDISISFFLKNDQKSCLPRNI